MPQKKTVCIFFFGWIETVYKSIVKCKIGFYINCNILLDQKSIGNVLYVKRFYLKKSGAQRGLNFTSIICIKSLLVRRRPSNNHCTICANSSRTKSFAAYCFIRNTIYIYTLSTYTYGWCTFPCRAYSTHSTYTEHSWGNSIENSCPYSLHVYILFDYALRT